MVYPLSSFPAFNGRNWGVNAHIPFFTPFFSWWNRLNPIKSPIKSPKLSPFLLGDVPQSSHLFPFRIISNCSLFSQMISHLPAPNTFTRKYSGTSATAQHRSTRRIPTPRCHDEGPKFRVSLFDWPIFDVDQWGMMFEYVWIIFWVSYFLIFDVGSVCWIWLNALPLKSFEVDSNHPPKEDGKKKAPSTVRKLLECWSCGLKIGQGC